MFESNKILLLLSKNLLPLALLILFLIMSYSFFWESHWDEIKIKNISCKEFDIPNCSEKNDISTIRDVYIKKPLFENNIIIRIRSKEENTSDTDNFEMIVNDELIQ